MADFINNILEIEIDDQEKRLEIEKLILNSNGEVDFELLIPIPKDLKTITQYFNSLSIDYRDLMCRFFNKFRVVGFSNKKREKEELKSFLTHYVNWEDYIKEDEIDDFIAELYGLYSNLYVKYGVIYEKDFAITYWGTSGVFAYERKKRTRTGGFYFKTVWGIPDQWLKTLSEKFNEANFLLYNKREFSDQKMMVYQFKNGQRSYLGEKTKR